jgi:cytochrome P450
MVPRVIAADLPGCSSLPSVIQTSLMWLRPFEYMTRRGRQCGTRFTICATSRPPLVFLSEPHEVVSVLTAPEETLRPGEGGATISPIVGERSFMLSDGNAHRTGRKTVIAAFHGRAVNRHTDMVADAARRALAKWPTDTPVAMHNGLRALTLEVILRTLTGRLDGALDSRTALLHRSVLDMLAVTASPTFVEPRLRHGPGKSVWQRFLRHRAQVDELLTALITDSQAVKEQRDDVLGLLATIPTEDSAQISARRQRDNAMSLILAGHETTAAQLAWAFQLLAHNPAVRDRLIREIDADVSDEYLTATIQEVLRHRCVFVFAIPRAVAKPVEIGGWTYEPTAHLLACIYLLHHDPAIYADPHAFRPERFLESPPDPRTWIPWGGGRKRCPGLHLAMLEMKVVLRAVLAERTPRAAARRMERPSWRSVIVTPHAGSQVVLSSRRSSSTPRECRRCR